MKTEFLEAVFLSKKLVHRMRFELMTKIKHTVKIIVLL